MKQIFLIFSFLLALSLSAGNVYYVKQGQTGNGSSWAQASGDLQRVINAATAGDEIHVAKGTYYPQYTLGGSADQRNKAFVPKDGVKLIGGYKGEDEKEISEPYKFVTTLSANIGDFYSDQDNAYHVLYIKSTSEFGEYHIQGFTIKDGYANPANDVANSSGGGIYINIGSGTTVTIINNILSDNLAQQSGGAIHCENSSPATLKINNNFINNNWSIKGTGGAINIAKQAMVTIQGNTIVRNSGPKGAGIAIPSQSGIISIYNNILWDNVTAGSDLYVDSSNNVDIKNNYFTVKQENLQLDDSNLSGEYPNFANPNTRDYSITKGSPAINAGDDQYVPQEVEKDMNGKPRIVRTVDIGAYEYQPTHDVIVKILVIAVNGTVASPGETADYEVTVEYSQKPWTIGVSPVSQLATWEVFAKDGVTPVDEDNIDLELGNENYFWVDVIPEEGPAFKQRYSLRVNMVPKPLHIAGMTVKDKSKDDTLIGELDNEGTLEGIVNEDIVYVDYTNVQVLFQDKEVKMRIPVMISGLELHGIDSLNYSLVIPNNLTGNILNDDASLIEIIIDGKPHDINKIYDLKCDAVNSINVELVIDSLATVISNTVGIEIVDLKFDVVTDRPMYKEVKFTITSQNGKTVRNYVLKIERRYPFDEVIKTKWNNTFAMDIAKFKTAGLIPKSYLWFKNETQLNGETHAYLAAGANETDYFEEGSYYHAAITFEDETTIHTCTKRFAKTKQATFVVYPNPAAKNADIYLQADSDSFVSEGGSIDIYDMSGNHLHSIAAQPHETKLPAIKKAGTYILKYVGKDGHSKSAKIIVK